MQPILSALLQVFCFLPCLALASIALILHSAEGGCNRIRIVQICDEVVQDVRTRVYGTAYGRSETPSCDDDSGDVECDHEGEQVNHRLLGVSTEEVLDTMIVRLKEHPCHFERFEEAVDR